MVLEPHSVCCVILIRLYAFLAAYATSSFGGLRSITRSLSARPVTVLPLRIVSSVFRGISHYSLMGFLHSSRTTLRTEPASGFVSDLLAGDLPSSFVLGASNSNQSSARELLRRL